MPPYDFLKNAKADLDGIGGKMSTLRRLGTPYSDADIAAAKAVALSQAQLIVDDLAAGSVELAADSELTALIAYLQRLGRGPQPTGAESAAVPAGASGQGS